MAEETFNCYLFAENWSWTLQNPTKNSSIKIVNIPTDLEDQEELRLNWIELYCQKFINPNTNIIMPGYTISAGHVQSNATVKVTYVEVNGVKYYVDGDSSKSWTLTDKKITLQPSGTAYNTATYANVTADPKKFKPSGSTKAIFDGKSKTAKCTINISGLGTNDANGVTFRHPYTVTVDGRTYTRVFGRANISKVSTGPTNISPSGLTDNTVWITNLSGKAKDGKTIKATSSETFKLSVTPSDAEMTGVSFSTKSNESCSLNTSTKVVTVKATNKTADNVSDTVTLSMKGDTSSGKVSTSFKVNFYKKPKVTFKTTELKVNIKRVASANYAVSTYDIGKGSSVDDISKGTTYSAVRYALSGSSSYTSWYLNANNVPNSSNNIPISRYLGIQSNSSNYFKIANEGRQHTLTYRYFNPKVQTVDASNNYNSDVTCKLTFYAKPRDKSQFSFSWLSNGVAVNNSAPTMIMPGIKGAPVPGNLKYTNASVEGGYCRAIKFSFYKKDGTMIYNEVRKTSDQSDGSSYLSGQIISKDDSLWKKLRQLLGTSYITDTLTVRANLVFFFNDSETTLYYGCNHTWDAKLWLVTEDDLGAQKLFPIVNETAPATPMMLTDVERFGYILPSALVNNANSLGVSFGVKVNGIDVKQADNSSYYSAKSVVEHLVVDVGKFVADNRINVEQCSVIPYVKIFTGKTYEQTIQSSDSWKEPNAVVDTTESSMWTRPLAAKGEHATYFDVQRFQQFIDKYRPLNNNQYFSPIVLEKRGDIINTDFWKMIEEKLDIYSKNMQSWASNVTNFVVIWAFPEFNHKKGEYITNNNLYQNYWDLLHMFSGYDSFATHDYLKDSGYTHNDLGKHTHDNITNKRGI